jgi:hypothetical protein
VEIQRRCRDKFVSAVYAQVLATSVVDPASKFKRGSC